MLHVVQRVWLQLNDFDVQVVKDGCVVFSASPVNNDTIAMAHRIRHRLADHRVANDDPTPQPDRSHTASSSDIGHMQRSITKSEALMLTLQAQRALARYGR